MSERTPFRFDAVELGPGLSDAPAREEAAPGAPVAPHPTVDAMRERFGDGVGRHLVSAGDEHVVFVDPSRNEEILRWLHDDPEQLYDHLADLTAVDHGGGRPLEVVYQLWSISHKIALRVKCELPLDALDIETVTGIWKGADWLEREVFDLFGIRFNGHPDLRRILMPETYAEGYPLRKDFPLRGRFSRAEQTRRALTQDPGDYYFPGEAGGREPQLVDAAPDDADEAGGSAGRDD